MFEVEFYEDQSGNEPIKDFIVELQAKGQTSKNDRIRSEKDFDLHQSIAGIRYKSG